MISRYDLMKASPVADTDDQVYPDVLTIDFNSFAFTQPPYQVESDERLKTFPYLITNAFYQVAAYDDIVFMINKIPHVSLLDNFPILLFPVLSDLVAFMKVTR